MVLPRGRQPIGRGIAIERRVRMEQTMTREQIQNFRTSEYKRIFLNIAAAISGALWMDSWAFGIFVWCLVVVVDELFLILGESVRLWAGGPHSEAQ